jgi:hypothetical protein
MSRKWILREASHKVPKQSIGDSATSGSSPCLSFPVLANTPASGEAGDDLSILVSLTAYAIEAKWYGSR